MLFFSNSFHHIIDTRLADIDTFFSFVMGFQVDEHPPPGTTATTTSVTTTAASPVFEDPTMTAVAPPPTRTEEPPTSQRRKNKKRDATTLRKAPQAPKRFKSSYICFFMAKQPEIKEELGDKASVTEVSKRSAEMWRKLPTEERAHWDEVAAKDKQRYMVEKATYTGPWQVPWKRAKKVSSGRFGYIFVRHVQAH